MWYQFVNRSRKILGTLNFLNHFEGGCERFLVHQNFLSVKITFGCEKLKHFAKKFFIAFLLKNFLGFAKDFGFFRHLRAKVGTGWGVLFTYSIFYIVKRKGNIPGINGSRKNLVPWITKKLIINFLICIPFFLNIYSIL